MQGRFSATGLGLRPDDLLRDAVYRRLWMSVLASSFGAQITFLALPLTAAVLLRARPAQMGTLTAMQILPFVLFSLPSGVWLDRMRKLRVYIAGELTLVGVAVSVPLAWWAGILSLDWLFAASFMIGLVNTTAGSAAQIVLTQIVRRDRLLEANARNALANSGAQVAGPGLAGALIKVLGAPLTLLFDAGLLLLSVVILSGIRTGEAPAGARGRFWPELTGGLRFVRSSRVLIRLAGFVAAWQIFYNAALVVTILFATRGLGLSGQGVGLGYICLGAGTVAASLLSGPLGRAIGPGSCLTVGFGLCACSWMMLSAALQGVVGDVLFGCSLGLFGMGELFIFINFIALRQAVTPAPMLGRMTSTMRWLILVPGLPGALIGGWLGEHAGLRAALGFAGTGAMLLTLVAWRSRTLRSLRALPDVDGSEGRLVSELTPP